MKFKYLKGEKVELKYLKVAASGFICRPPLTVSKLVCILVGRIDKDKVTVWHWSFDTHEFITRCWLLEGISAVRSADLPFGLEDVSGPTED